VVKDLSHHVREACHLQERHHLEAKIQQGMVSVPVTPRVMTDDSAGEEYEILSAFLRGESWQFDAYSTYNTSGFLVSAPEQLEVLLTAIHGLIGVRPRAQELVSPVEYTSSWRLYLP
jgi:hypothetical protein